MKSGGSIPRLAIGNRQRRVKINLEALQKFADVALREVLAIRRTSRTDLQTAAEVHIWLVSDRRMSMLHRRFMNIGGATDVITFQHGEIFISAETARRNARPFGSSLRRELQLYIVHGLLHLHGFSDRSAADAKRMAAEQERILKVAAV